MKIFSFLLFVLWKKKNFNIFKILMNVCFEVCVLHFSQTQLIICISSFNFKNNAYWFVFMSGKCCCCGTKKYGASSDKKEGDTNECEKN
jgi:hypothetical protein